MKYAVFFLACSVGLAVVAFPWAASSVLLLWGSLALGVVGLGYVGVGPRIFGKSPDGRMRPLNVLVLAPYLLPTWSLWHLSRALRREAPFNQLVEGITIGRRLLPGEYPEEIESVVDLTAEFPESFRIRQGRIYLGIPDPGRVTLHAGGPRAASARDPGAAGRRLHPLCGGPRPDSTGRHFSPVGSR